MKSIMNATTTSTRRAVMMTTFTLMFASLTLFASQSANASPGAATQPADDASQTSKFQRDRQAILGMAGEYRVTFRFRETVPMRDGYELDEPYKSGATEFVKVIEDTGERIVLQHILVLEDQESDEMHVVKHWRQDWRYEDRQLHEFQGDRRWAPRQLGKDEAAGTWTQAVFQVDDSPRYEGYGQWRHHGDVSYWTSNQTWRPLPRRELKRDRDYAVLVTRHRVTVTPNGWYHEQDSRKRARAGDTARPYLVREVGLNTYEKIDGFDFSAGREYWSRTKPFWRAVRDYWREQMSADAPIALRGKVDGQRLYERMFELADEVKADADQSAETYRPRVAEAIERFLVSEPAQSSARR